MTLEEHARAIEAAIKAAAEDGLWLSDSVCDPVHDLELNKSVPGCGIVGWVQINVPN